MSEGTEKLRKSIANQFRINAFTLKKEALDRCVELLQGFDNEKRAKWLGKLLDALRKQSLTNSVIDKNAMNEAAAEVSTARQDNIQLLDVFSAFSVPRWEFSSDYRMLPLPAGPSPQDGLVSQATNASRQRLLLVLQRARRLMRSGSLVPVEGLLGGTSRDSVSVVGMLAKIKSDGYHIEDLTGTCPIELSDQTKFGEGVFAEGAAMLFKGKWDGAVLCVEKISLVPCEAAEDTRTVVGTANWFGGGERAAFSLCNRLKALEAKRHEASIAFLSEVHLDNPKTMAALYAVLTGFSSCPPTAFVFCGNFCSSPLQPETSAALSRGFSKLNEQIRLVRSSFEQTKFIFVPGPTDPCVPYILPHPPLPPSLVGSLTNLPNCILATNPARLQYATQEIVVFRADTVERLCRDALHVPSSNLTDQVARTVLSNAHVAPVPDWAQPVVWPHDVALRLHPLPDLLLLADRFSPYTTSHSGCTVANPSSFGPHSFDFLLYDPSRRKLEESRIDM